MGEIRPNGRRSRRQLGSLEAPKWLGPPDGPDCSKKFELFFSLNRLFEHDPTEAHECPAAFQLLNGKPFGNRTDGCSRNLNGIGIVPKPSGIRRINLRPSAHAAMAETTFRLEPNEEARFNELLDESYRKVYNMAYRLSGSKADAEDLTQEAFFRAYRSFNDFEGDRPFENWIFRIVTRLFLDMLRSRRRRVKSVSYDAPLQREGGDENLYFDMADHTPNAEQTIMAGSLSEEMQEALDSLSAEQRTLVILADVENIPYKDIAEMLNKPVGTIRSRLHRTHKLIRHRLEQARRKSSKPMSLVTRYMPSL